MGTTQVTWIAIATLMVTVQSMRLELEYESSPNPSIPPTSTGRISSTVGGMFMGGTNTTGVAVVCSDAPNTVSTTIQNTHTNCDVIALSNSVLTTCDDFVVRLQNWTIDPFSGLVTFSNAGTYSPQITQRATLAVSGNVAFVTTGAFTAVAEFAAGSFTEYIPIHGGRLSALDGNTLVVAGSSDFFTYDITDNRYPVFIAQHPFPNITSIDIQSKIVVVATRTVTGTGKVTVYDVTTPVGVIVGEQFFPEVVSASAMDDGKVFLAFGATIDVYETVSDLLAGVQATQVNLSSVISDISVSDGHLYAATEQDAWAQIKIIEDTAVPTPAPTPTTEVPTPVTSIPTSVPVNLTTLETEIPETDPPDVIIDRNNTNASMIPTIDGNETDSDSEERFIDPDANKTTFGDPEVLETAKLAGYAASGSIILGTSGAMISRQVLLSRFTTCEENTDDVPPFLMYPLGIPLAGSYWKGAILGNTALIVASCIAFAILHAILSFLLKCCGCHRDAASVAMRYPACMLPGILVLLPPIMEFSFLLLFKGGGSGERLFAFLGFTIVAFFSYLFLTYGATDYSRCEFIKNRSTISPIRRYLLGPYVWVTTDDSYYVECNGILFESFKQFERLNGNYYFIEFWQILPISLLAAIDNFCLGRSIIIIIILVVQLVMMIKTPIYNSPFLRHMTTLTLLCTTASLGASLPQYISGDSSSVDVSNLLMRLSLVFAVGRILYDLISIFTELVTGWKRRVREDRVMIGPKISPPSADGSADELSLTHLQYSSYDSSPEQSFSHERLPTTSPSCSFSTQARCAPLPPKPLRLSHPNILLSAARNYSESYSSSFAIRSPLCCGKSEEGFYSSTNIEEHYDCVL